MRELLLGSIAISFAPVFVKLAAVSADAAAFWRMAFGLAGLLAVTGLQRLRLAMPRDSFWPALGAAVLFAADLLCWHRSILSVGPGLATLLANFQVFLLIAAGWALLGSRPTARGLAAPALALAGLWLILGPEQSGGDFATGVGYGLAAAVLYAGYLLLLRRATARAGEGGHHPVMVLVTGVSGVLCALFLAGNEGMSLPPAQGLVMLAALGLVAQVAGWRFISRGLPRVSPGAGGLLLMLQPCLAYVWDVLFFAKPLLAPEAAGAVLALAGIALGANEERRLVAGLARNR
ncbi:MAG: DMT family transporter [Thermodesulfobacteriota bacterium]